MSRSISVIGGGVFLPPGHPSEDQVLEKLKLYNPDYKMALGLREKENMSQCQTNTSMAVTRFHMNTHGVAVLPFPEEQRSTRTSAQY